MKTEYDAARLIYNRFKSAISYKPTIATVLSPDVRSFDLYARVYTLRVESHPLIHHTPQALETNLAAGGHLDTYEFEGPDRAEFVQDLAEFQLAAVRSPVVRLYPHKPCAKLRH